MEVTVLGVSCRLFNLIHKADLQGEVMFIFKDEIIAKRDWIIFFETYTDPDLFCFET